MPTADMFLADKADVTQGGAAAKISAQCLVKALYIYNNEKINGKKW